jgi:DNA-binding MurR/RpiR family transcriptional regulator
MENLFSKHDSVRTGTVVEKLQALLPTVSPTEARIVHYLLRDIDDVPFETGASLAKKANVSEITVSRLLRKAGYKSIAGLKRELQEEVTARQPSPPPEFLFGRGESAYETVRDLEIKAIQKLFDEFEQEPWKQLVETVAGSQKIYITGFQSVRGTSEDLVRRLGLARDNVHYLSPHDNMLGEWLSFHGDVRPKSTTLILIDVVPYAREGMRIASIAKEMGIKIIVISDEFCDWAHNLADHAIFANSRSGLFLESTVALTLILNVLVDAVVRCGPGRGQSRFEKWQMLTKRLEIF